MCVCVYVCLCLRAAIVIVKSHHTFVSVVTGVHSCMCACMCREDGAAASTRGGAFIASCGQSSQPFQFQLWVFLLTGCPQEDKWVTAHPCLSAHTLLAPWGHVDELVDVAVDRRMWM